MKRYCRKCGTELEIKTKKANKYTNTGEMVYTVHIGKCPNRNRWLDGHETGYDFCEGGMFVEKDLASFGVDVYK